MLARLTSRVARSAALRRQVRELATQAGQQETAGNSVLPKLSFQAYVAGGTHRPGCNTCAKIGMGGARAPSALFSCGLPRVARRLQLHRPIGLFSTRPDPLCQKPGSPLAPVQRIERPRARIARDPVGVVALAVERCGGAGRITGLGYYGLV